MLCFQLATLLLESLGGNLCPSIFQLLAAWLAAEPLTHTAPALCIIPICVLCPHMSCAPLILLSPSYQNNYDYI